MHKKDLLAAIKFNFECYERGLIDKEDFLQAVEEEMNKNE